MNKSIGLVVLMGGALIAAALVYGEWQRRQEDDRQQAAHLLASCVNQGLLSLFRLQANDWKKKPDFHRQEEISLQVAVAELPEKILAIKPSDYSGRIANSVALCESLTENSIRQHGTIFGPVGNFAEAGPVDPAALVVEKNRSRQARTLRQLHISARAAERYLEDLETDLESKLIAAKLDARTEEFVRKEIRSEVLDYYQQGDFSRSSVERYIARREKLAQLLADNPRGYSRRGGTLYFYDPALRRSVDSLSRALSQGHTDVIGNWQRIVRHQQRRVEQEREAE